MSMSSASSAKSRTDEAALREDLDALKADLMQLRDDLKGISRDAMEAARSGVGAARERVNTAVHSATDRAKEIVRSIEKRIEDQPLAAVGIALGVGILLGSLLRR